MVRKPVFSSPEQQPPNMQQYPPPGLQGPPYDESSKPSNHGQWPGYSQGQQQSASPYPSANSPRNQAPIGPYGTAQGESQDYYRPPYQPNFSQYESYQSQGYPHYGNNTYGSQIYPPQQYGQQQPEQYSQQQPQQYQPPAHGSYGSSNPPGVYPPHAQGERPYAPGFPPPAGTQPQIDEERGLMGALAGGAAGGYAGHKMHHGFIGALGGAYAGHKLEDKYKEHYKTSPAPPAPVDSSPHDPPPSNHAGNFSASARNTSLDGDYDLIAECTACDGGRKLSSISLNNCLTNDDGHFRWVSGGNFGGSARDVKLLDGGRVLEAELRTCDGIWRRDRIVLDERIENSDGDLKMILKMI